MKAGGGASPKMGISAKPINIGMQGNKVLPKVIGANPINIGIQGNKITKPAPTQISKTIPIKGGIKPTVLKAPLNPAVNVVS